MSDSRFFAGVEGVFTDLDGTLTTGGKLLASTYSAIAALADAGIFVVLVTGRPAGWAEAFARTWPLRAVIAENGGVIFVPRLNEGTIRKLYSVPKTTLPAIRRRMHKVALRVADKVPGARLSVDAVYTEVNLALDWNEEVHLPESSAQSIELLLREAGYNAVRSSVHVNFWPGHFDKLSACRRVIRELGETTDLTQYLYVGDALNDEPLFSGFSRSVGVANVRKVWTELKTKPAHVTRAAEGHGFEEVARAILSCRRQEARAARRSQVTALKRSPARF